MDCTRCQYIPINDIHEALTPVIAKSHSITLFDCIMTSQTLQFPFEMEHPRLNGVHNAEIPVNVLHVRDVTLSRPTGDFEVGIDQASGGFYLRNCFRLIMM